MIRFHKADIQKRPFQPKDTINLKMKMIGLIALLILSIVLVIGIFLNHFITDTLEAQMGEQALSVAESVALNPDIAEAFKTQDPAAIIQPLVSPVQQSTAA